MTLDDALTGLKNYWSLRPNGGTRTELIALARARGFEEPLLNVWLDVFLAGFRDQARIATATYPALAALVAQIGVPAAHKSAEAVFLYLTRPGSDLDRVRKQDMVKFLDAEIAVLAARLAEIDAMVTAVTDNLSPSPHLPVFVATIAPGRDSAARKLAVVTARRDALAAETA